MLITFWLASGRVITARWPSAERMVMGASAVPCCHSFSLRRSLYVPSARMTLSPGCKRLELRTVNQSSLGVRR